MSGLITLDLTVRPITCLTHLHQSELGLRSGEVWPLPSGYRARDQYPSVGTYQC